MTSPWRSLATLAVAVSFASLACSAGCTTDEKGANCGFLDAYIGEDDELYCPDPDAPDDCDALLDETIDVVLRCANSAGAGVTEEQLRAELEAQDALPPCDDAVATTSSYDVCITELNDLSRCNADGTFDPPESCDGSVLAAG